MREKWSKIRSSQEYVERVGLVEKEPALLLHLLHQACQVWPHRQRVSTDQQAVTKEAAFRKGRTSAHSVPPSARREPSSTD